MTDRSEASDAEATPPPSLGDAVSHVQDAVLAMVAAARSALDVVERLATDPGPLLDAAARAAEAGREAAATWTASPVPTAEGEAGPAPSDAGGPSSRPRVQHIRVDPADG